MKWTPIAGANVTFGGDSLAYVVFTDNSQSSLEAGRGLSLSGGLLAEDIWTRDSHALDLQATLAVKFASTKAATNGEVTFTRWPIEFLGFYQNSDYPIRVGTGFSYHFANKVSGSGIVSGVSADVNGAFGFVTQVDYLMGHNSQMSLGLRFESLRYQVPSQQFSADGTNLGLQFMYFWRADESH